MTAEWCRDVLQITVDTHGAPEILKTDQGSQFTATVFTECVINKHNIRLSMDGKSRAIDNIFI